MLGLFFAYPLVGAGEKSVSIVITSVIYAALIIMVSKMPVAVTMHRKGGYNNRQPREQQA